MRVPLPIPAATSNQQHNHHDSPETTDTRNLKKARRRGGGVPHCFFAVHGLIVCARGERRSAHVTRHPRTASLPGVPVECLFAWVSCSPSVCTSLHAHPVPPTGAAFDSQSAAVDRVRRRRGGGNGFEESRAGGWWWWFAVVCGGGGGGGGGRRSRELAPGSRQDALQSLRVRDAGWGPRG